MAKRGPAARQVRRDPAAVAREAAAAARDLVEERRRTAAIWLAVFSPLAWIPNGFSRFVAAKLLVMAIACVVGATVSARSRLPRVVAVLLAVGAVVFTVAALAGDTPLASLIGRWPRYEGLPVLGLYAASAWLGARLVDTRPRVERLAGATAAMACTLGAFSILDAIGWSPLGAADQVRDGSLLGNATDQGLVAMMAVAILVRPAWESRRELHLIGLAAAMTTVVLSGSRFAIAITLVVLAAAGLGRARSLLRPALVAVGLLVVAVLALPQARDRLLNAHTVKGRLLAWDLTLPMVGDKPLLGFGPSRYVDAVGRYETRSWIDWAGTRTAPDSPHDWLLQVTLAGGIPLLLCALALVVVTARRAWAALRVRPELAGVFAAVAGYGAAMLANFTIASSTCLAAFLAGCLLTVPTPAEHPEPAVRRWAAIGIAGIATAALLLVCVSEIYLQSGLASAGQGRIQAARADFDTVRHLRPGDADVDMIAAQALAALADGTANGRVPAAAAAEQYADRSLDATPATYESRVALGVALRVQDRLPAALHTLDGAITDFPLRPKAYTQRAIVRFGLRDVAGARSDLRTAIGLGDRTARQVLRSIEARLARSAAAPIAQS
ncbi:O-antigen ligase family protein [Nocardioides ultimimeridianus]